MKKKDTNTTDLTLIADELVEAVRHLLDGPMNTIGDSSVTDAIPANVELLTLIGRQEQSCIVLPNRAELLQWKKNYMSFWEKQNCLGIDKSYIKKEKRSLLQHTFDELIKLSA